VFQWMMKSECYFIDGTEKVRFVERLIYNREQLLHFDSDVGYYVGDTPEGEKRAQCWNNKPERLEFNRNEVDRFCRVSYELYA
ncbi:HB2L protein, partial [Vireo altiloquus]|nr:HB2L protein [Vireo altiloquus]